MGGYIKKIVASELFSGSRGVIQGGFAREKRPGAGLKRRSIVSRVRGVCRWWYGGFA